MLSIEQLRYGTDNFAYLIHGKEQAIAIDGGAWQEILAFLRKKNLILNIVTNTHSHFDHTSGNENLLKATGAKFLSSSVLPDNHEIILEGEKIAVYRTPGHTNDSVCFHTGNFLVSGDTLFNATIGNCFPGNLKNFYLSIKRLMSLPDETIIYAGHDYIAASLTFARHLEKDNKYIDAFHNTYRSRGTLYSTIADEHKINPYMRFNEDSIIGILRKNNLPHSTEWERWNSLMSIE